MGKLLGDFMGYQSCEVFFELLKIQHEIEHGKEHMQP